MAKNENLLTNIKDFADNSLSTFGIIPPDKMSLLIKECLSRIDILEKEVDRLKRGLTGTTRKRKSSNNNLISIMV